MFYLKNKIACWVNLFVTKPPKFIDNVRVTCAQLGNKQTLQYIYETVFKNSVKFYQKEASAHLFSWACWVIFQKSFFVKHLRAIGSVSYFNDNILMATVFPDSSPDWPNVLRKVFRKACPKAAVCWYLVLRQTRACSYSTLILARPN